LKQIKTIKKMKANRIQALGLFVFAGMFTMILICIITYPIMIIVDTYSDIKRKIENKKLNNKFERIRKENFDRMVQEIVKKF